MRAVRALRVQGYCPILPVGVLYAESPVRLLKSADLVVDGPVCAKAFIDHLVYNCPGSALATATWHCLLHIPGIFGEQVYHHFAWADRSSSRTATTLVVTQTLSSSPWLGRTTCQTVCLTNVR